MLIRTSYTTYSTLGFLTSYEADDGQYLELRTLELAWKKNRKSVSCIPAGSYKLKKRHTEKHGDHLIVQGVKNRTFILIHSGNFTRQIKGCILVGMDHVDIDHDNETDVTYSRKAMKKLMNYIKDEDNITLEIV